MKIEDIGALILLVVVLIVYVGLIVVGVKVAQNKNRSPHWMWFAVHPLGLIVVLIVMACLRPLARCPQCAQKAPAAARLCGYCGWAFSGPLPSSVPGTGAATPAAELTPGRAFAAGLRAGYEDAQKKDDFTTLKLND
jgi:hypothetical protein